MFPYQRLNTLFHQLKINPYTSPIFLANRLQVSERTIRSDIQVINDILISYGAQIKLKRRAGYYIEIKDEKNYHLFLNSYLTSTKQQMSLETSEERIKYILGKLLYEKQYVSLNELESSVFITKNTLNKYLNSIKELIINYHLYLDLHQGKGARIIGKEEDIRKCILENILSYDFQNYIVGFTKEEYIIFQNIDLDQIGKILSVHLKNANIKPTDFNRKNLIIHFALMISRIQNGFEIQSYQTYPIEDDIQKFLSNILGEISDTFQININLAEQMYIYSHFVSNTDLVTRFHNETNLRILIENLLDRIYQSYHFDLRNDEVLIQDLFLHFRSILKSKEFHFNKRNPLLNTIKNNFPLPYEITLTSVVRTFSNTDLQLTEDEIGYISLHIGAAMERCFSIKREKKNALLICGSGQATSRMLEARIDACFKDRINVIKCLSYNEFIQMEQPDFRFIDFAISTIEVESNYIPTIIVNFTLDSIDIEKITVFLNDNSIFTTKSLDSFFDKDLFIMDKLFDSKEQLLKVMSNQLANKEIVDTNFFESVMERESIGSTNMNSVFALPHPFEHQANQTKVAVAILPKPLKWTNDASVQIVFMLAVQSNDHQNIEHLYDIFIQIINNTKLQNEIINTENYDTFLHTLLSSLSK